MSKPSANSLSLASLFTLTTTVAVVIWVTMYAPWFYCLLVPTSLPAIFRMLEYGELARSVKHTLTLTELCVGYLGASAVSLLAGAAILLAISQPFSLDAYRPHESDTTALFVVFMFAMGFLWPVLASYFLVGELWLFPKRFVRTHRRLPNYWEQLRVACKAISVGVFVLWAAPLARAWVLRLLPPEVVSTEPLRLFALLLLVGAQVGMTAGACLLTEFAFHRAGVRVFAGTLAFVLWISVKIWLNPSYPRYWDGGDLVWGFIAAIFIAAPALAWPARLTGPITEPLILLPEKIAPPPDNQGEPLSNV